jgi:DNA repair photolyase
VDEDFEGKRPLTTALKDDAQSIISHNDSPDIGFTKSLNPYRGCEHGCSYCYARPYHEYLGFNAGLDFETRIMVKHDAPRLLEEALAKPSWKPTTLACSGVTDCYQPLEKSLKITRGCLEVLSEFRNPVGIITKNALVTRDIDLLQSLANHRAAVVVISITTLDTQLSSVMEPRASSPGARLRTVRQLSEAGIPVGVSIAPIIPGLNDHEIPSILSAAKEHGAQFASGTILRLPYAVKDIFSSWLDQYQPNRKDLILSRVRELRRGKLNHSEFGERMKGNGPLADQIQQLLQISKQRLGLNSHRPALSTNSFRRCHPGQLELFP